MCKLLITSGSTVNAQDFEKNTPVHYAAFYSNLPPLHPLENIKILKLLLEKKPDLTIKNKKGQTAIDITNSKTIISLFWHYLTGDTNSNSSEENKRLVYAKTPGPTPGPALATPGLSPSPSPTPGANKTGPMKKVSAKIVFNDNKAAQAKAVHNVKQKEKELAGSETLPGTVLNHINKC